MSDFITTAARRLTRHHNAAMRRGLSGGFVLVNEDGTGGAYYTRGSAPAGGVRCTVGHLPLTFDAAQDVLDSAPALTDATPYVVV